ncbi:MAG: MarR family winged helix-turn-helix transcriptional regulator, partial [Bradymonadaceae bacterium]
LEGTRASVIAEHIGITRQAVGKLIADLEEMGMLERIPDPTDGRAQLIKYSTSGQSTLLDGLRLLKEMEEEFTEAVGDETMEALHQSLLTLREALDPR